MRTVLKLIVTFLVPAAAVMAGPPAEKFAPVGDLAGSCWRGVFDNGAVDIHCYEWAIQHAFLRDAHEVRSPGELYEGETFYGWDEVHSVLRYWYFNSLGGVSTGEVRRESDNWNFAESYERGEQSLTMRTKMERPDPDSYLVVTETLVDGKWGDPTTIRYERIRESSLDRPLGFESDLLYTAKRNGNSDLWLRRTDGSTIRLTTDPERDNYGIWSPDGSRIAFQTQRDGNYEIYVMAADGSDKRNLTNHPAFDGLPAWSPDGSKIAFFSQREIDDSVEGPLPGHIYLIDAEGGDPVRVTRSPLTTTYGPSGWSPDGSTILLSRVGDRRGDVFTLDPESGAETLLVSGSESEAGARYSPDGTMIAFYADGGERSDIVVVLADGSARRVVTTSVGHHYYPSWSPDGRWITISTLESSGDVDIRAVSVETGEEIDLVATGEDERESSWRPGKR